VKFTIESYTIQKIFYIFYKAKNTISRPIIDNFCVDCIVATSLPANCRKDLDKKDRKDFLTYATRCLDMIFGLCYNILEQRS
jgi:hypothetical protein